MPRTCRPISYMFRHVGSVDCKNRPLHARDWGLGIDPMPGSGSPGRPELRPIGYLHTSHFGDPRVFLLRGTCKYVLCDGTLVPRHRKWYTRYWDGVRFGQNKEWGDVLREDEQLERAAQDEADAAARAEADVAVLGVAPAMPPAPPPPPTFAERNASALEKFQNSLQRMLSIDRAVSQRIRDAMRLNARSGAGPQPAVTPVDEDVTTLGQVATAQAQAQTEAETEAEAEAQAEAQTQSPTMDADTTPAKFVAEHGLCASCWSKPVSTVFTACGCSCICIDCANALQESNTGTMTRCVNCNVHSPWISYRMRGRDVADAAEEDGEAK